MSAEHHNYCIEAYLACGLLGVRLPTQIATIGVTPKSVDVTTHNGEPSEYRGRSSDTATVAPHRNRLTSQHIMVDQRDAAGPAAWRRWVSQPNRLKPQRVALYRSAAEKRTIKHSDSTPRHQLAVWRGVVTSDCQRP